MNLKCFFGFHDYQPVDGLYWKYYTSEFRTFVKGINVVKLYRCTKCNKITEHVIESYPKDTFDLNTVRDQLPKLGVRHIFIYYVNK